MTTIAVGTLGIIKELPRISSYWHGVEVQLIRPLQIDRGSFKVVHPLSDLMRRNLAEFHMKSIELSYNSVDFGERTPRDGLDNWI